jgi:hypothetical protein
MVRELVIQFDPQPNPFLLASLSRSPVGEFNIESVKPIAIRHQDDAAGIGIEAPVPEFAGGYRAVNLVVGR